MKWLKKYIDLDPNMVSAIGKASLMGMHMVSGVVVGSALGWFLDWVFDTSPWFLLVFFIFGVAAGFLNVWRDMHAVLRAQEASDKAAQTDVLQNRESKTDTKQ